MAAQEQHCRTDDRSLHEVNNYRARPDGNSLVSTLSPTARSLLDINPGDELTHHIDVENRCIIIEVGDGGE